MIGRLLPGGAHLQNPHPLFVHYPIALLTAATLFYGIAWIRRSDALATAAFWMLVAGTAMAAVTAGTGLYAEDGVMLARDVKAKLLEPHETLMLITGGLAVAACAWAVVQRPFPRRVRPLFVLLLLVMVATMLKGADYGGRMVYDYNGGGTACGQPIEFTK